VSGWNRQIESERERKRGKEIVRQKKEREIVIKMGRERGRKRY
jgi:hypothetical protein